MEECFLQSVAFPGAGEMPCQRCEMAVSTNNGLPSLKTSKKWVSSGGGLGGSGPKPHWGMRLLDKIMILQGVKLIIQPLGVGYANRPKKAKMRGYVAFSPYISLPAWL